MHPYFCRFLLIFAIRDQVNCQPILPAVHNNIFDLVAEYEPWLKHMMSGAAEAFPFHLGEPYHQFHSNFFMSDGMPYPSSYTQDLWHLKDSQGEIPSTGCPDGRHQ